jgi:hypothetical protein
MPGHLVTIYLICCGTAKLFSMLATPFYIHIITMRVPIFPYSQQFLLYSHLSRCETVSLHFIYISLMPD